MNGGALPLLPSWAVALLPSAAAAPVLPLLVAVEQTPPQLQSLSKPLSINGSVIAILESGKISLKTDQGIVDISLSKPQQTDALRASLAGPLTLELLLKAGEPPKQALLMLPLDLLNKAKGADPANPSLPPPNEKQEALPSLRKGQTLTATLLPDDIGRDISWEQGRKDTQPLSPISHPTALSTAGKKQEQTGEPMDGFPSPLTEKAHDHKTGVRTDQRDGPINMPIKEGAPPAIRLKVEGILEPESPWPREVAPEALKATVANTSRSGHMLLECVDEKGGRKTAFVHNDATLRLGTKLILLPQDPWSYDAACLPVMEDPACAPIRSLVDALAQTDLRSAAHFIQNQLPNPLNQLAGTALFLLAAIKKGRLEEWLGEPVALALEKAGRKKAATDFLSSLENASQTIVRDPVVGEWKAYPLPLHYGSSFDLLRLHVHQDDRRRTGSDGSATPHVYTRFVITMNMSRLGAIQLDGLTRQKRLDLVVRSETPLPPYLERDLRETAMKTLEATGLTGSILFQTDRRNWMTFAAQEGQKEWVM